MKKILLIVVCCMLFSGCRNNADNKNKILLIGEWYYIKTELGESQYSTFTFNEDGTFYHSKCFSSYNDSTCSRGEAEWNGTYFFKGNRLNLKIDKENQIVKRYNSNVLGPPSNLVVDFDNMYFCDGNEGLDCNEKYKKD